MIIFNSSFYEDSEIDIPNNDYRLLVTSAGHHILKTLPFFDTVRPNGRRDYQILYVKNGNILYTHNNVTHTVPNGGILIYKPYVPQNYSYNIGDSPDIYWIHFTGSEAESILKRLNLDDKMSYSLLYSPHESNLFESLFDGIIKELSVKKTYYTDICNDMLHHLLCLFSRNISTPPRCDSDAPVPEYFNRIVETLNTHYSENYDFNELANQYNISTSQLIKLFNKYLKMSPQKYLTNVRIKKAKTLLRSDNKISIISEAVGYPDQLYFSRVFHKATGMSPTEYRGEIQKQNKITLDHAPWNKKSK